MEFIVEALEKAILKLKSDNFASDSAGGLHIEPGVVKLEGIHQAEVSRQDALQREVNKLLRAKPLSLTLKDGSKLKVNAVKLVVTSQHNVYLADIAIGKISNS